MTKEKSLLKNLSVYLLILIVLILLLFSHWEIGSETWGYWYFAKVFSQTQKSVIMARSPLYTLYLNLFLWMGYPLSVTVEYIVTFFICALAIVFFLRPYIGMGFSLFATLLWLPFLILSEPPVLALGFALSCLALVVRRLKNRQFGLALSYALFISSAMVRVTYFIFIPLFGAWDITRIIKRRREGKPILADLRLPYLLPLLIMIFVLFYCLIMQSPNPWNNIWFSTTTWFPTKGKASSEAAFIQEASWKYIDKEYGTFKNKDFYSTHREIFKDADTMSEMIKTNPSFVFWYLERNLKDLFLKSENLFGLDWLYSKIRISGFNFKIVRWSVIAILIPFLLFGVLRMIIKDKEMLLFMAGILIIYLSLIWGLPQVRYMVFLMPLIILSVSWYGGYLTKKTNSLVKVIVISLAIILVSLPRVFEWGRVIKGFIEDIKNKDIRILQIRPIYMRGAYKTLLPLIKDCNGIISYESKFIGAFMGVDLLENYDIWEIPPFGTYSTSSVYNKLRPSRVNCVFLSSDLKNAVGYATNSQIRYQNYIKPYTEYLIARGAFIYETPGLGELVILREGK